MSTSLEQRVARLERTNRILWILVLSLAILSVVGFRWSQESGAQPLLSAQAFQLVDREGKSRAELKVGEEGPGLFILDAEGRERVRLVDEQAQTGLFLLDSEGQVRVGAAQFSHGGGGFALHGPQAKGAAVLYLKGEGSLSFFDSQGKLTGRVPASP